MKPSRVEKEKQLGMSLGKAYYQLQKLISFNLANELNMNICYRCNKPILNIDEWSIDHKTDWLHSSEPNELFFCFDNIAFSHHRCNSGSANRGDKGSRKDKTKTLGINFHTACHHLRRLILYNLAKLAEKLHCHHCQEYIDSVDLFSIEHIIAWLHSKNPVTLYFDYGNISFSHKKCNRLAARMTSVVRSASGLKGVFIGNDRYKIKKYYSQIYNPNTRKPVRLGYFADPFEAARVYDQATLELYGDKGITNELLGLIPKPLQCASCSGHITRYSISGMCFPCWRRSRAKVQNRPSRLELIKLILTKPFTKIGKQFGVSDNAVRKWCHGLNLPYRRQDILSQRMELESVLNGNFISLFD